MRRKVLLATFLVGVSLCFAGGSGYGEVQEWMYEAKKPAIDAYFLEAKIEYMMYNPIYCLNVYSYYDPGESLGRSDLLSKGITTNGKIYVMVYDTRGLFAYKSGKALLDQFNEELEIIYSYIDHIATDMNSDIVAKFLTREEVPLGYFHQGLYQQWLE